MTTARQAIIDGHRLRFDPHAQTGMLARGRRVTRDATPDRHEHELHGKLDVQPTDPHRYGPDTDSRPIATLHALRTAGGLDRLTFQINDVTGPEHDRTYVCAARLTVGDFTVDVVTHGTGSKAAKRGAAVELLALLREYQS